MANLPSVAKKYCKLVMVTEANNNKFYEMICEDGNTITINYGRIELTSTTYTKPVSQWDSIYNSKVKKGYKDVTRLVSVEVTDDPGTSIPDIKKITDARVNTFISLMKNYTDNLVSNTYSVKCDNVSQQQIDEAQTLINELKNLSKKDVSSINKKLIELYTVIPRYMSNVKAHILPAIDIDKLDDVFTQEQDNLDAMASQVAMYTTKPKDKKSKKQKTILDVMGISMKEISPTKELDYLIKQITNNKIESVFEVNKAEEDNTFSNWLAKQKNKDTRILIHGTRCTSVIPILEQGLKIRPKGNFSYSGKAYGDGNYFSEVVNKSLNYTGYDSDKILLVYEVHTGNPFVYDGWYRGNDFALNYTELSKRGYDSTYVKAGNGLLNSEIIAYKEQQNRIKYIIWLKNKKY